MRATTRRWVALAAVLVVLGCSIVLITPPLRSLAARTLFAAYLSTKGLRLTTADVRIDGHRLDVRDLAIDDSQRRPVLSVTSLSVSYRLQGRRLLVEGLDVDRLHLIVRRAANGSFDLANAFGGGASGGAPASGGRPNTALGVQGSLRVRNSTIDFENDYAPARIGRAFGLHGLEARIRVNTDGVSAGTFSGILAARRQSTVSGSYRQDAILGVGDMRAHAAHVDIASLLDYFISSAAFVAEDGMADANLHAYALGPSAAWSIAADGAFDRTRLRVLPVIVPIRDVHGPFAFVDGMLILPHFKGVAAGLPMAGRGTVALLPGPWVDLTVAAAGPLSTVRELLAFTKPLKLHGDVTLATRVLGAPDNPQVGIGFAMRRGWRLAQTPIGATEGELVYTHGHVTVPAARTELAGITAYASGDIDVGSAGPPTGQLIAIASGSSTALPWVTDLDPAGVVSMRVAFSGSLAQPDLGGFMELSGRSTRVRGAFSSDPAELSIGPLVATDRHGGQLVARAQMLQSPGHATSASLIADQYSFELNGRRVALPGIVGRPVGAAPMSGLVDGIAVAAGQRDALLFDVGMHLRRLVAAGTSYGDADVDGEGAVRQRPSGQVLADLRVRHRGGGRLGDADANAIVGLTGTHVRLYSANAHVAGGTLGLSGDMQLGSLVPTDLLLTANHIQLDRVGVGTAPTMSGELTALGRSSAVAGHPRFDLSATARAASLAGKTLSGDAEVSYNGDTLTMRDSRVLIGGGSAIDVSGSIGNVGATKSWSQADLDLDAQMHNADVAELAALAPGALPLGGVIDATAHIGGQLAAPSVSGDVASAFTTVRGVAVENIKARIAASGGAIDVEDAQATLGTSQLHVSGRVGGGATSLALASPHLDLADFNDFFGGKDVLAGAGSGDVAMSVGPTYGYGSGSVRFAGVAIEQVPLGTVQAKLMLPERDRVALDLKTNGAIGSSSVVATIGYRPAMSFAASAPTTYSVTADLRDVDVAQLESVLPRAAEGLRGRLTMHASAWGVPRSLHGSASFHLADGYIHKDRIADLSGSVLADDSGIEVQNFHTEIAGVELSAHGTYGEDRHFQAHARLSTADVAQLERITAVPQYVQGPALLDVDASGTATQPQVHATLSAGKGSALGVAYDKIAADMTYRRGTLAVKSASLGLAAKRGTLSVQGTLPMSVGRQAKVVRSAPSLQFQFAADRVDLAAFDPLLHGKASLEGELNARALATGSLVHPHFDGTAQLRGGVVRSALETVPLTKLDADAVFAHDVVTLQRLHGVLGKGTIDAHGNLRLVSGPSAGLASATYDMHLSARRANLSVPQYFSGVIDADVAVNTETAAPQLNSDIIISDTDIPLAGILALASSSGMGQSAQTGPVPGVPPYHKGHTIMYGGQIYGTGDEPHIVQPTPTPLKHKHVTSRLALNVDASAGDNVNVTGIVNATGSGTVHVGGTASAPVMSGDLDVIRGTASLFDTTFHILRGRVAFHPSDGMLPTLNAEALAFRPEADITARVYGRVDQLHTELESDPPMSEQDILADMLHISDINQSLSGGSSANGGSTNAGVSLERLAGGEVTGQLLSAVNFGLERTLHIEEVDLAFNQNGQPTLEMRKQYGKNMFAIFRSSFSAPPDEEVGVMYEPRSGLEVEWLDKQNTAGQTFYQQGQYQTWQVLYRFPNKQGPGRKPRPSSQAKLTPVNLGP